LRSIVIAGTSGHLLEWRTARRPGEAPGDDVVRLPGIDAIAADKLFKAPDECWQTHTRFDAPRDGFAQRRSRRSPVGGHGVK